MTIVTLRPACSDDATWAHALRNRPHVRAASLDPSPIPLDVHIDWWEAALLSTERHLSVIEYQGAAVGVVRLDVCGSIADMSIYLYSEVAGQGIGRRAILAAVALAGSGLAVQRVNAVIREENITSQRAFASAGFLRTEHGWSRAV